MTTLPRLTATVTALGAAAAAIAVPGGVISSFLVPGISSNGPRGLAYDGTGYYAVADNRRPNQVRISKFEFDGETETATVVGSFNCPTVVYWAMDLAWRPGRIYVASDLTSPTSRAKIYVLNDETGSKTNEFNSPFAAGVHVNGLTWDGSFLYASSYESDTVYRLGWNGSILGSFAADHAKNHALASDGVYLWLASGRPYFDARAYTTAGSRLTSFTFKVNEEYVGGACRGRPSLQSLFVSTFTGGRYIYEVGTDPREYGGVNVAPTSFGRLKALFH